MSTKSGSGSPFDGVFGMPSDGTEPDAETREASLAGSVVEPTKTRHSAAGTVDPLKTRHSAAGVPTPTGDDAN